MKQITKSQLQTINAELKQENEALKETVTLLLKEIDKVRSIDRSKKIDFHLSAEQRILEMQIQRLEAISNERQLTLEETRALDLHIKNKRLLDDKSTINADYTKVPDHISESDLLRIAGSSDDKQTSTKTKKRRSK